MVQYNTTTEFKYVLRDPEKTNGYIPFTHYLRLLTSLNTSIKAFRSVIPYDKQRTDQHN
jgi:hypothetical protein